MSEATSEPFIVEIWGEPAGIVLPEGDAFRFHATSSPFFPLDGEVFRKPGHARLAAAQLRRDAGPAIVIH
jgi:hypothetical protein